MRIEDIKQEFPKTPDDIRQMIEEKVEEQLCEERVIIMEKNTKRRTFRFPKTAAIAAAAMLLMGTTVFAGVKLYQIYTEKNGTYGVQTVMEKNDTKGNGSLPDKVPEIEIKAGYLPEGMVQAGDASKTRIQYENAPAEGGISMMTALIDTDQDKVTANDTYVVSSEMLSFDGHDGVYLEKELGDETEIVFDKRIYLFYPEFHRALIMEIANNVTKEEALKVAEHLELVATGKETDAERLYRFSEYGVENKEENAGQNVFANKVVSAKMKNLHSVGESFKVPSSYNNTEGKPDNSQNVEVKVVSVDISDELSLLTKEYIPEEWKMAVDSEGKLVQNELTYYQYGDGINTLDEVVKTETVKQKLVYITLEYTNTGDEIMKDILFFGTLNAIRKDGDTYEFIDYNEHYGDEKWNYRTGSSVARLGEMPCFDLGGQEKKNYISSLNPGESAVVHMAWIVNESDLDQLYLNLNTLGEAAFDQESLEIGYVNICR